ncbi:MAG: hypothetical protein VW397_04640 [Candidatus Margulisiibacteriota bacterium]
MSKYFLLFIFILSFGCSKTYLDSTEESTTTSDPFTVASTYSSVDYSQMTFNYTNPELVRQVEVRRETTEVPLTEYDGELVFLDTSNKSLFYDYKVSEDKASLNENTTYYYSIFYRSDDMTIPPKRLKDIKIKTLSYKEGMLQFLLELISYSLSVNNALNFVSSTELLSLFVDTSTDPVTFVNPNLNNAIDGILLHSLKYKPTNSTQTSLQTSLNHSLISTLKTNERLFVVDYCTSTNTTCVNDARSNYENQGVVGLIHPNIVSDIKNDFPDLLNESASSEITSLNDEDIKNFVFIDSPFSNMISQLSTSNYDMIMMTPFSSSSWSNLFSSADVERLKKKNNGTSRRLVYAYIDVSKVWKTNTYYWNALWDELESRPNWIDRNVSTNSDDFYIKFWRSEWREIIKPVLKSVIESGYDGLVFGGGEKFSNYPLN